MKLWLLALALAVCAGPARADWADWAQTRLHVAPAEMIDKLNEDDRRLVTSREYADFIKSEFLKHEEKTQTASCGTFAVGARSQFLAVDAQGRFFPPPPVRLTARLKAWFEKWSVEACGRSAFRSLLVIDDIGGYLTTIDMVPGQTHTDPAMQMDTIRVGTSSFLKPGCQEKPTFMDSEIVDDSQFMQHRWSEAWTVRRCGNDTVTRLVQYSPGGKGDPDGTTITVLPYPPAQ